MKNSRSKKKSVTVIHKERDKQHKGDIVDVAACNDAHDVINASKIYFFFSLLLSVLRLLMYGNLLAKILPLLLSECLCWIRRW